MKDFSDRREQEKGALLGQKVDWLVQGYFPSGDGRRLSGRFSYSY